MHEPLDRIDHRPWPLPAAAWGWRQSWLDIAFVHYRADAAALQARLPPGVRVQEFDGTAWVGLVQFRMAGIGRRPVSQWAILPPFPELNVRTYVEADGKPGVWFFSLDAASWPLVLAGRHLFHLPYFHARMTQKREAEGFAFTSVRRGGGARFRGRYRPSGPVRESAPGTFEHWSSERYCLYTSSSTGRVTRVQVHHVPWPLQPAEVEIEESDLLAAAGLTPLNAPPVCHYSKGVHVISFPPETIAPR